MKIEDQVPATLVGAPGDAFNNAEYLLEVLAVLTTADEEMAHGQDFNMGVYQIVELVRALIKYERAYPNGRGGEA